MAILTLRDGKRYQERCSNCRGIHITDRKEKGSYVETERFVCADCGQKAVAPALECLEKTTLPVHSETFAPGVTNGFLLEHTTLLLKSFAHWMGRPLMDASLTAEEQAQALFHAPFALVSHNTAFDPVFNYANGQALALFEMSWKEFTAALTPLC